MLRNLSAIERQMFSRFHLSALGLAVGHPSPLGLKDRQLAAGLPSLEGNTPGGVIGWGPGAGDYR